MKRKIVYLIGLMMLLALALPAAAQAPFPEIVPLPTAFQPEGIAIGQGSTFYTGSLADGTILKGNLRTGESDVLVPGQVGQIAVGMSYDSRSGYLFVAGGLGAVGRVYDGMSGALLAEYPMASGGAYGDFINDVIVTRQAAYFTNSFAPYLYRVPLGPAGMLLDPSAVEAIPLSGDWVQEPGPFVFNANGIEATPNGKYLIVVNSVGGALFLVNPSTGMATGIDLGGEQVPFGDGLLMQGETLFVVQNQLNQVGVVTLAPGLDSGTVGSPIVSGLFNIPTTTDNFGNALYVVNAKFGADPAVTDYEIVRVSQP